MNLTTTYLGLELRSPLVVGAAAPLSEDLANIKWLEDAGAAAIVLHSLFEEQIEREKLDFHHTLLARSLARDFVDPHRLGDADRVDVQIVIWQGQDVLQVPLSAFFRCNRTNWCTFVVKNGKVDRQQVSIGQRSDLARGI